MKQESKGMLRDFLANPPQGSAGRRALEFGIDLSLTYRNMFGLTMSQRLEKLEQHLQRRRSSSRPRPLGKRSR